MLKETKEKFGFGMGSPLHVLVCSKCHGELKVGKSVPYDAECPNGCGRAKTIWRFAMLRSERSKVHRMVVIPTTSKEYYIWERMKNGNS